MILVSCLVVYVALEKKNASKLAIAALATAVVINVYYLYPYAPFAPEEVKSASQDEIKKSEAFSIMVANVYMQNRRADELLSIVRSKDPTILLTMEVNDWWVKALQTLETDYPHKILLPLPNTYGMALYSKLPLNNIQKLYFNHDSVPSLLSTVNLSNGHSFDLLTIHPVAPKASEHPDNKNDTEIGLIAAAKTIKKSTRPAIVAGDFNDVGWSPNTTLFEEISGLEDVRYGRGLYNTFSANNFFMRWPLDYVFTSPEFRVVEVERLPKFGSDHFPFYAKLLLSN